jgi:signal transduction histidine kinase
LARVLEATEKLWIREIRDPRRPRREGAKAGKGSMNVQMPDRPTARVLVVDVDEPGRSRLRTHLDEAGYRTDVAGDGGSARALLASTEYAVVISESELPDVSATALVEYLRRDMPGVQVILMDRQPTVASAAAALRAGACDYLAKPVDRNAALRSVGNAVRIKEVEDERRRLAAENRAWQSGLERLVEERTRALQEANRRLEAAMLELQIRQDDVIRQERLNALGQMVSGIAHDFNNALMPIVGLSDYFLTHADALANPDRLRADLESIRASAEAAMDVVRRLREFYRPEEALIATELSLARLVDQVFLLTEPSWKVQAGAEGRIIRAVNDVPASLPPVLVSEPRLREVLINLVLNAADALPTGGTIRIGATCDTEFFTLTVADTGTGMSEETLRHCFEPFYTTKGPRGSGLGLATVYGIVTRHGGQVTVDSKRNRGTTFTIRLPLAPRKATPAAAPTPAAPASSVAGLPASPPAASPAAPPTATPTATPAATPAAAPTAPLTATYTVLVVDDEFRARDLIVRFLQLKGHTVLAAESGQEGLEVFRRNRVDVVMTDRGMPDLSGDVVAADVKRQSPTTPVIMLTGFGDLMNVRQEHPDGVDLLVAKPVTPDQLQAAVMRVMAPRNGKEKPGT